MCPICKMEVPGLALPPNKSKRPGRSRCSPALSPDLYPFTLPSNFSEGIAHPFRDLGDDALCQAIAPLRCSMRAWIVAADAILFEGQFAVGRKLFQIDGIGIVVHHEGSLVCTRIVAAYTFVEHDLIFGKCEYTRIGMRCLELPTHLAQCFDVCASEANPMEYIPPEPFCVHPRSRRGASTHIAALA